MDIGFNEVDSFGCVLINDDLPYLYIMDEGELLDGIPFLDDNEMYTTLDDDELIIVGVSVRDPDGEFPIDARDIDDDNYDELTYVVTPLKFYTLKTPGLTNDDVIDLHFFDLLIQNLIDGYVNNLNMN